MALLVVWNKSPEYAAIGALITTVLTSFLSSDRNEWLTPKKIVEATIEGAKNVLPVAVLLAAAGLIVGTFTLTGLGLKISSIIMSVSGGLANHRDPARPVGLHDHRAEPAHHCDLHHDRGDGGAGSREGRDREHPWLTFSHSTSPFSRRSRRLWASLLRRCCGHGRKPFPCHDARVEVFFACFSGALLLLRNGGGIQSADPGGHGMELRDRHFHQRGGIVLLVSGHCGPISQVPSLGRTHSLDLFCSGDGGLPAQLIP